MIEQVIAALPEWIEFAKRAKEDYDYLDGRHSAKFVPKDVAAQGYAELFKGLFENLCPSVVSGFTDDIRITSWDGTIPDEVAQSIDRVLDLAIDQTFTTGDSFIIVWPNSDGLLVPILQPPGSCVPVADPNDPGNLLYLVKVWIAPDNRAYATVYGKTEAERWVTKQEVRPDRKSSPQIPDRAADWQPYETLVEAPVIETPFANGKVPAIWVPTGQHSQFDRGRSILESVKPIQDKLNKFCMDELVVADHYSREMWAILNQRVEGEGVPSGLPVGLPTGDDATPQPVDPARLVGVTTNLPGTKPLNRRNPTNRSVMEIDGPGPITRFTPSSLPDLTAARGDAWATAARVVGLPLFHFTMTGADVPSGDALVVLSSRKSGRINSFTKAITPAVRGLAELLGYQATPVWYDPASVAQTATPAS